MRSVLEVFVVGRFWLGALILGLLFSKQGFAAKACAAQANTKYESAFCRVIQSSHGRGLPSLIDFRRNSQKMQYLLLRKPAAKLGISLAPPAESAPAKPAAKAVDRPLQLQLRQRPDASLASITCSTEIDHIRCGKRIFRRLQNRSNKHVRPAALGASNRLLFSPIDSDNNEAAYLLASYVQYLNRMDSIGLAGSTSSYSAFAHTYYEHQRNGSDFVERFRDMFELLKQDKKNIGVSRRRPVQPPAWHDCEVLNNELIACYSQGMNLVYQASR